MDGDTFQLWLRLYCTIRHILHHSVENCSGRRENWPWDLKVAEHLKGISLEQRYQTDEGGSTWATLRSSASWKTGLGSDVGRIWSSRSSRELSEVNGEDIPEPTSNSLRMLC